MADVAEDKVVVIKDKEVQAMDLDKVDAVERSSGQNLQDKENQWQRAILSL